MQDYITLITQKANRCGVGSLWANTTKSYVMMSNTGTNSACLIPNSQA